MPRKYHTEKSTRGKNERSHGEKRSIFGVYGHASRTLGVQTNVYFICIFKNIKVKN